ncbi:MAG: hypothetical protein Rubg2KO_15680 [Rubricoccaceae bacterium]
MGKDGFGGIRLTRVWQSLVLRVAVLRSQHSGTSPKHPTVMFTRTTRVLIAGLAAFMFIGLSACATEEAPATDDAMEATESMEEATDDAMEATDNAMEEATDTMEEATDDAMEGADEAADDAMEATEEATDEMEEAADEATN